jgi:hypothetical protein
MTGALWILVVVLAVALAYTLQFAAATLSFGRELSDTGSPTGFQDAVTPPWETNFALTVYVAVITIVVVVWWREGWASGLSAILVMIIGAFSGRLFLPKPTASHFRQLIIQSMCSRYADYVRDGDKLRAHAMKQLLTKAGIDPDAMRGAA